MKLNLKSEWQWILGASLLWLGVGCATHIDGTIVDASGLPISGDEARVNIVPLEGGEGSSEILVPDTQGRFRSTIGMGKGTYLIEALVPGYKVQSQKVVAANAHNLKLQLEPLKQVNSQTVRTFQEIQPDKGAGSASITPPQL